MRDKRFRDIDLLRQIAWGIINVSTLQGRSDSSIAIALPALTCISILACLSRCFAGVSDYVLLSASTRLKMKVSCQYPCGCVARCGLPAPVMLQILGRQSQLDARGGAASALMASTEPRVAGCASPNIGDVVYWNNINFK